MEKTRRGGRKLVLKRNNINNMKVKGGRNAMDINGGINIHLYFRDVKELAVTVPNFVVARIFHFHTYRFGETYRMNKENEVTFERPFCQILASILLFI